MILFESTFDVFAKCKITYQGKSIWGKISHIGLNAGTMNRFHVETKDRYYHCYLQSFPAQQQSIKWLKDNINKSLWEVKILNADNLNELSMFNCRIFIAKGIKI